MATTLYFRTDARDGAKPTSLQAPVAIAYGHDFSYQTAPPSNPSKLLTTQGGANMQVQSAPTEVGYAHYGHFGTFVSDSLGGGATISGTITASMRFYESSGNCNLMPYLYIYLWHANGTKGPVLFNTLSTLEAGTSYADRVHYNAVAITSGVTEANDRLVIEVFSYDNNTRTAAYTHGFQYGSTTYNSYITFSTTLPFVSQYSTTKGMQYCVQAPKGSPGQTRFKDHVVNGVDAQSLAQTDYPLRLKIYKGNGTDSAHEVYMNNCCANWPYDIKFYQGGQLLDFWREPSTDNYETFQQVFVELKNLYTPDASTTSIKVVYGDGSADASNGPNTFLFFDHFDGASVDTNKWVQNIAGSQTVSNSVLTLISNSGTSNNVVCKTGFGGEVSVRARVRNAHADSTYTELLWWRNAGNDWWNDIDTFFSWGGQGPKIRTAKDAVENTAALTNMAANTWHTIDIKRNGSSWAWMTVYWNKDDSNTTYQGLTGGPQTSDNRLGIEVNAANAKLEVDYILVRKYVLDENTGGQGQGEAWQTGLHGAWAQDMLDTRKGMEYSVYGQPTYSITPDMTYCVRRTVAPQTTKGMEYDVIQVRSVIGGGTKEVTVLGGNTGVTDYPLMLTVNKGVGVDSGNTIYLNNRSTNWPYDVYFQDSSNVLLKYCRESYTADQQIVWVDVTVAQAPATSTLRVYHGHGGADKALPWATFPTWYWFDHFDNGNYSDNWTVDGSVGISTESGTELVINNNGTSGDGVVYAMNGFEGRTTATNCALRVKMKLNVDGAEGYSEYVGIKNSSTGYFNSPHMDSRWSGKWWWVMDGTATRSTDLTSYHIIEVRHCHFIGATPNTNQFATDTGEVDTITGEDIYNDWTPMYPFFAGNLGTVTTVDWMFGRPWISVEPTFVSWHELFTFKYVVRNAHAPISIGMAYSVPTGGVPHNTPINLGYNVSRTPTAPTKNVAYKVKFTPTAKSANMSYSVKRAYSNTESIAYTVTSHHSSAKGVGYTVQSTPVAPTKNVAYKVQHNVPTDKSLKYIVHATRDELTKGMAYAVRAVTQHSATADVSYKVRSAVTPMYGDLKYAVLTKSSKTASMEYVIRGNDSFFVDLAMGYAVRHQVDQITESLGYLVQTATPITSALSYTALKSHQPTKSMSYSVVSPVGKTKGAAYSVLRNHSATESLAYNVLTEHYASKGLSYNISVIRSATEDVEYKVLTVTSTSVGAEYVVVLPSPFVALGMEYVVTAMVLVELVTGNTLLPIYNLSGTTTAKVDVVADATMSVSIVAGAELSVGVSGNATMTTEVSGDSKLIG